MAVENGVQNAELGYLLFPFEQYSNLAGKPLVGGHMEIYEAGTDTKYISYSNWDGAENPFRIPIPNDGRITVLADPTKTFDCYLYDSYNNLVCSRLNVQANVPGNINIEGADTVIKNTDGTLDVSLRTLGNNVREYTVNTHNKVLDVQEPLYFVENSNTATVIGFSGDEYATTAELADKVDVTAYNQDITNINNNITALSADVSGKMDVSKLEYNEDNEISAYNGSAFAGQGGAGDPEVNDLVHANSATWNNVSAKLDTTAFSTVSGNFLTAIPDNYATKDYVQSSVSSKLDSTAFSTVSGSFLTAHQSLDGLMSASLLGLSGSTITSYNNMPFPLGGGEGDAEVNQIVHANSGDWNNVSAKLDTTAFSTVSGNFLTAHQDLSDYLTKSSADTLYQPIGDYADATALDSKVDTSSFTAFSSTTNEKIEYISGALSGSYELSAGNGIDITDYPNEQKTVISVTAQGCNTEVEDLVTAQSATWDSVTGKADTTALNDYATTAQLANKLDTTAFSDVSGTFLTAHQSLEGYATEQWVGEQGYLTTAYNPEFAYHDTAISSIDNSALYDTSAHARINTLAGRISNLSSDKADTSALTAYQEITGMTAYQPAGSYLTADALDNISADWNEVSAKLDTTAFSDVSGSFLTAVPDTYLQNTDLTVVDNKITEISGVQLSAGTEIEFEYDAADNISAINSSAISTTPSQPLYAKSPLYAGVSGTSSFIGINSADLAQILGIDETVLWSGSPTASDVNINLSEPISGFERFAVEWRSYARFYRDELFGDSNTPTMALGAVFVNTDGAYEKSLTTWTTDDGQTYVWRSTIHGAFTANQTSNFNQYVVPLKIIGINRKENV